MGAGVLDDLTLRAPHTKRVVLLAGIRYREFLVAPLCVRGVTVEIPMKGLRIGEQLKWLWQN